MHYACMQASEPSSAPPTISTRTSGLCKISSLHPYEDDWKLKCKLMSKVRDGRGG